MDFKRMLIGLVVAMLLVIVWQKVLFYMDQQHPEWGLLKPTTQPAAVDTSATQPTSQVATTTTQGTTVETTQPASPLAAAPAKESKFVTLGSSSQNDPSSTMGLTISPVGAGLSEAALNDFRSSAESKDRYVFQQPYGGETDDNTRSLATRSIVIDGATVNLLSVPWELVSQTTMSATYRTTVDRVGKPAVKIEKTYTLSPRSADTKTPQGWEVTLVYKVNNLTGSPINVVLEMNGPTAPHREIDRGDDRVILGGYLHEGFADLTHNGVTELNKDHPTKDLSKDSDGKPLLWVGLGNNYFNALVCPDPSGAIKIEKATAFGLKNDDLEHQQVLLQLQTGAFSIPANGSATMSSQVFLGPKQRKLLNSEYYTAATRKYEATLVMTSGPCGYCTFVPIINGLYSMLNFFHWIFGGFAGHGDWGLAIIGLVFVVRACLHPITKKSQVNMAKMSKMGPEIERLKKKHGDNKDELNKAMMEFYKTQGATPILGCLPMLLQMPIWFALYNCLQNTFELRQASFLWGFTWIKDLAQPDWAIKFSSPISLYFTQLDGLNILPILLGIVSLWQARVMQAQQPPPTTPEQEQQRKMMLWMPLMLPVFLYKGPAGLNLYIMTSTTFGIIESKIIRKHIKEREEAEKAGVVIVDKPADDLPPPGSVRRKKNEPDKPKSGGFMSWIADIQKKAEDMQREQKKRKKS